MALPKLNDLPTYSMNIPSTGSKVKYRPFLVKEQKVLLIALESQDQSQILDAIVNTIQSCVIDPIDVSSLATFDIEYMFTQIRSKSVGESTKVSLKCSECNQYTEVEVDLSKVNIEVAVDSKSIKLNDDFVLRMKYPSYKALLETDKMNSPKTMTEALLNIAIMCLDTLKSEDDNIRFADEPRSEIESFLDNLTSEQLDKILSFVNSLPKLQQEISFTCSHCNHDNKITLEGISDFFS